MMPTTRHKQACATLAIDRMRAAVLVLASLLLSALPVAHGHEDGDIHFTLLIGVPSQYREALEHSGFQVIVEDQ
jgi:hypothetical protein